MPCDNTEKVHRIFVHHIDIQKDEISRFWGGEGTECAISTRSNFLHFALLQPKISPQTVFLPKFKIYTIILTWEIQFLLLVPLESCGNVYVT
jgi:hypothetical protein